MYPERTKEGMGAGREIVQNYGSLTLEVEILRFGRRPRNKGGRPKKLISEVAPQSPDTDSIDPNQG